MIEFRAFRGEVVRMNDGVGQSGCDKMITLIDIQTGSELNIILTSDTYVLDQEMILIGDIITGYIDANAPAILIYPPQYQALVVVKESPNQNVKVAYFNDKLVSNDNQLQINLSPQTRVTTTNGQAFTQNIANHNLIVVYGASTKSIPAQTTPKRIIVLC